MLGQQEVVVLYGNKLHKLLFVDLWCPGAYHFLRIGKILEKATPKNQLKPSHTNSVPFTKSIPYIRGLHNKNTQKRLKQISRVFSSSTVKLLWIVGLRKQYMYRKFCYIVCMLSRIEPV